MKIAQAAIYNTCSTFVLLSFLISLFIYVGSSRSSQHFDARHSLTY